MSFGVYLNLVRRGDNFYRRACVLKEKSNGNSSEQAVLFSEALQNYQKAAADEDAAKDQRPLIKVAAAAFHCREYKTMWEAADRVIELSPNTRDGYLLRAALLSRVEFNPDAILTLQRGLKAIGSDALMEQCLELLQDIMSCTNIPLLCHHRERGWHAQTMVTFLSSYTREKTSAHTLAKVLHCKDALVYLSLVLRVDLLDPSSRYTDMLCPDPLMGPLHFACWHGQLDQVTKLLDNFDNDIHESGLFGLSPLHIAAVRGHAHIVHTLLQHGAEPGWSDPGLNVKEFAGTVRPSFWRELLPCELGAHC